MENELRHWGIKGMKWGIRRYRNPDGTLTEAGKKRYGPQSKQTKKKASEMTDEELRKAIDRMNLEKNYKQLVSELHPDKMKRVRKVIADIAENGVRSIATKAITVAVDRAFAQKKEAPKTDSSFKDVKDLTDDELRDRINRIDNEKKYNDYFKTKAISKTEYSNLKEADIQNLSDDELAEIVKRIKNEDKLRGKISGKAKDDDD